MAVDLNAFMRKSEELYDIWPSLFQWAGPALIAILGAICWFVWWLRGHRIDTERNSLKEQINALRERLSLAKEQADGFKSEMEKLQAAVTNLNNQIAQGATPKELAVSSGKASAFAESAASILRVLFNMLH